MKGGQKCLQFPQVQLRFTFIWSCARAKTNIFKYNLFHSFIQQQKGVLMRKGQSISINTIIIAAIALAVLVVLFAIFTGRLGLFSKGIQETTNCDQACKSAGYTRKGESLAPITEGVYGDCSSGTKLTGYYEIVGGVKLQCCCIS